MMMMMIIIIKINLICIILESVDNIFLTKQCDSYCDDDDDDDDDDDLVVVPCGIQAVALVHQRLRIVSVRLHGDVSMLLRLLVISLEEINEREIRSCNRSQRRILSFEGLLP